MRARHADHNAARAMGRAALALAAIALLAAVAAAQPPPPPKPRLSMHVPVPPAVVVTEGLHRLIYELHIENRVDVTITLSSLEIRTDTAQSAITLDGDRLVRALDAPADRKAPLAVAAGQRRVVYLDLGETSPPRVVRHVLRTTP